MGIYEFKLPDIGEGVVEGEVVEWMVSVGDSIKEDDPILSVMTDKATVEIPSPVNGVVTKIIGEPGDILPVGEVCIEFEVDGDGNASSKSAEKQEEVVKETPKVEKATKPNPEPVAVKAAEPVSTPEPVVRAAGTKALASPAVRQRARQANIDLQLVAGSGPAGRISHADLDRHIAGGAGGATSFAPLGSSTKTKLTGTEEIKVIDKKIKGIPKIKFNREDGSPMNQEEADQERELLYDEIGKERLKAQTRLKRQELALDGHKLWRRNMGIDLQKGIQKWPA